MSDCMSSLTILVWKNSCVNCFHTIATHKVSPGWMLFWGREEVKITRGQVQEKVLLGVGGVWLGIVMKENDTITQLTRLFVWDDLVQFLPHGTVPIARNCVFMLWEVHQIHTQGIPENGWFFQQIVSLLQQQSSIFPFHGSSLAGGEQSGRATSCPQIKKVLPVFNITLQEHQTGHHSYNFMMNW